jgi:hypothetical protein
MRLCQNGENLNLFLYLYPVNQGHLTVVNLLLRHKFSMLERVFCKKDLSESTLADENWVSVIIKAVLVSTVLRPLFRRDRPVIYCLVNFSQALFGFTLTVLFI